MALHGSRAIVVGATGLATHPHDSRLLAPVVADRPVAELSLAAVFRGLAGRCLGSGLGDWRLISVEVEPEDGFDGAGASGQGMANSCCEGDSEVWVRVGRRMRRDAAGARVRNRRRDRELRARKRCVADISGVTSGAHVAAVAAAVGRAEARGKKEWR